MELGVELPSGPSCERQSVRFSRLARTRIATLCFAGCALAACAEPHEPPRASRGDPQRGREALAAFECRVCHYIPGVRGASGYVGPPLDAYARKVYIAGKFPNDAETLVRFIRDAPALAPETAMPAFAMSEAQAYDIAAYLYSLQ